MNRFILLLLLSAQSVLAADAWIGFKAVTDNAVPKSVQESAKSVLRILMPGDVTSVVDLSDPSKIDSIVNEYESKKWELIQLAYCRVQKILKCPVSSIEKLGGGSAFVFRNSKTVATNLHNLRPWLSAVIVNNGWMGEDAKDKLRKLVVPIFLLDQTGAVVYNPANALTSGAYQLSVINGDPRLFSAKMNPRQLLFAFSDYVELQFENEFKITPLQISTDSQAELFYNVGYPGPTTLFAKLGAGDGDGQNEKVSVGARANVELDSSSSLGTKLATSKYFATTSAPSYVGNSGGPVLTPDGKVFGIVTAGDLYREINSRPAYFTDLINLTQLSSLKIFWVTGQP